VVASPTGTTGSLWRTTATPSVTFPCALARHPPDLKLPEIVHPVIETHPANRWEELSPSALPLSGRILSQIAGRRVGY
jgi:hypothetical protein